MAEKWTQEQKVYAQNEIKKIVDWINSVKVNGESLSPLEKFICAFNYVSDFAYNEENLLEGDSLDSSREIEGIYSTRRIVCYGYANLLSRLCDGLGIPCLIQDALIEEHANGDELITGGELHANNLVFLKDEKYGIDGVFYTDACWDALKMYDAWREANPNPNYKQYNWCLIPYGDPKFYSSVTKKIKYEPESQFRGMIGLNDFKNNCIRLRTYLGLSDDELRILEERNGYADLMYEVEELVKAKVSETVPISPMQFYEALKIVEQTKGRSVESAETIARQTMRYNAFMSTVQFDTQQCHGCFSQLYNQNNEFGIYETPETKDSFKIR